LVLSCGISEDLEDPEELRMELAGLASLPPYALKWRVSKRVSDYLSAILSSEAAETVRDLRSVIDFPRHFLPKD